MQIILCEDVVKVGQSGELRDVSDGFARNYLIPKKLALIATPSNLKQLESLQKGLKLKAGKDLESAQALAAKLGDVVLEMGGSAGREGHLFGAITSHAIAEAFREKGFSIDKKNIVLESPIKSVGEYTVSVRLNSKVTAEVKVKVTPKI